MTKKDKFILDACCGYRMMWFNKKHPNALYLDQRAEVKPDIIGDFRYLKRFKEGSFKLVVFDPPHIIGGDYKKSNIVKDYGELKKETWKEDLKRGLEECWRILEAYGVLIFKWSDTNKWANNACKCNLKTLLTILPTEPLFGHTTRKNKNMISSTYWFCFMKIPEEELKKEEVLKNIRLSYKGWKEGDMMEYLHGYNQALDDLQKII